MMQQVIAKSGGYPEQAWALFNIPET